jgi:hypothetical protein
MELDTTLISSSRSLLFPEGKLIVAWFEVLSIIQEFHGGNEENKEKPLSVLPVSKPRFEHETSRMRNLSLNHLTVTFGT